MGGGILHTGAINASARVRVLLCEIVIIIA